MRYETLELAGILNANQTGERLKALRQARQTLSEAGVILPTTDMEQERGYITEDASIPPKPHSLKLGDVLRRFRFLRMESQDVVALKAELPRSTLNDIEWYGDRTEGVRDKIVHVLGIARQYLQGS